LPLISEEYRKIQESLHDDATLDGRKVAYGGTATSYAPIIAALLNSLEANHVLDYGCGKHMFLARALTEHKINHKFKYQAYDPAVPRLSSPPVPAEVVLCIDVLEHVEEDSIDEVLDHLRSLTEAVGMFSIATGPAMKSLPDGRNAHILQRPIDWWLPRIMCRFDLQSFQRMAHGHFYVIVTAQEGSIESTSGLRLVA